MGGLFPGGSRRRVRFIESRLKSGAKRSEAESYRARARLSPDDPTQKEEGNEAKPNHLPKVPVSSGVFNHLSQRAGGLTKRRFGARHGISRAINQPVVTLNLVVNVDGDLLERGDAVTHVIDVSIVIAFHGVETARARGRTRGETSSVGTRMNE